MGYLLEELGHKLTGDERFQFYLTNTLEEEELTQTDLPGMASLSEESHLAAKVKKEKPILVILGNPPYSGISANASEREVAVPKGQNYIRGYTIQTKQEKGRVFYHLQKKEQRAKKNLRVKQKTWIGELIEYYKIVDGKWFGERKHWLQDDYVKFIRFAQWKIDQIGEGVVGFITNHAYLDNITFRGMRQSLMNSFDEIHILDLHGNSFKKEKAPDGSQDNNVFDIQQGVAIALFVKRKTREGKCRVYHAELWGPRQVKYDFLESSDVRHVKEIELKPVAPSYFLVPKDSDSSDSWQKNVALSMVFPTNVTGIVTARDAFVIDSDRISLRSRISQFRDSALEDAELRRLYQLKDTRGWKLPSARTTLQNDPNWEDYFTPILYRPFDVRWIYYSLGMVDWGRPETMRHMLKPNLSLCGMRQVALDEDYSHFLASQLIVDNRTFSSNKGIIQQFPLYLYPDTDKHDLFTEHSSGTRVPNLAPELTEQLTTAYGKQPSPEDVFYYIYAVLYSTAYRNKYAEFLKTDFPRVPFTKDHSLFQKLADQGAELVGLHLLKSKRLAKPIAKCEGKGDLQVVKITYDAKRLRVMISPDNWFAGVPADVWEYHIGGYQVAAKWLKDRKGRTLSSEEIVTYARVITALAETIKIQSGLDALFERVESAVLEVRI
jgi:predicted helicase